MANNYVSAMYNENSPESDISGPSIYENPTSPSTVPEPPRRLYRSRRDRMLGGVCGGLGQYFNVDSTAVRLLWIFSWLACGVGILPYLIAWIAVPEEPLIKK